MSILEAKDMKQYKYPSNMRRYWREAQAKYRAKKKGRA